MKGTVLLSSCGRDLVNVQRSLNPARKEGRGRTRARKGWSVVESRVPMLEVPYEV